MNKKVQIHSKGVTHFVLVYSYMIFLFAVIIGVLFDLLLKKKIFSDGIYQYIGFFMLLVSSLIIFWAQKSSVNYKQKKKKDESLSHFEHGPYRYLRNPTHFGLFIMTLGFSLIINSLFSVIFTILAYIISKSFFLKKEEKILESKYGEIYTNYKKKVKNWI